MAFEKRKRRLIFSWTTAKGLLAILLHLTAAFVLEYVVIVAFLSYGLADNMPLTGSFKFPGTDFIFTMSISPVFHLIPIGEIITLLSSWMYLTRHISVIQPETTIIVKKQAKKKASMPKRVRFKNLRRFTDPIRRLSRQLKDRTQRISFIVKSSFRKLGNLLRVNRISSLFRRSYFARAAVKGSAVVLSLFFFVAFTLYLVGRPTFLYELVVQFYRDNPYFREFVLGTHQVILRFAQSLSFFGLATPSLDNMIAPLALSFRTAIINLVAPLAKAMIELNVLSNYLICQNVAAWVSALSVLLYGRYSGS